MNNQQFRRLLEPSANESNGATPISSNGASSSSLGTKRSSLIPMTPRTVRGSTDVDFARQVRERNAGFQPRKKFKTAAPKGVKYAVGYTDRAKARAEAQDAEDDKATRIKALEEQMKLGQLDQATFESLRDTITGGDIASTHLVKGLDRQLLERVRRGEDVLGDGSSAPEGGASVDIDEELEKFKEQEVETVKKDKVQKKGSMAPPPVAGVKRSRDEIMAELKAQRKAAAEAKAAPALDASKWRKVGDKSSKVEIDHKGREVLITVDEDGVVKKKVRKRVETDGDGHQGSVDMPDASRPVLGSDAVMPVPQTEAPEEEEEEDDIFEGVGTEYNPLGDDDSDEDSDHDSDHDEPDGKTESKEEAGSPSPPVTTTNDEAAPPNNDTTVVQSAPETATKLRSYFKDTISTTVEAPADRHASIQDLLKKAAKLDSTRSGDPEDEGGDGDAEQKARLAKRAQMLAQRDRDLDDLDMGFGASRDEDGDEDGDGKKIRLSEWKSGADEGWEEGDKKDGKKKRKPKKRKGDANNMSDIMKVIEGRKTDGK